MTDLERQLLERLIAAAFPLHLQIALALAVVVGYFIWSRIYFRVLDRLLRAQVGRALGVQIIWVLRHSSSYQTPFESGFSRYHCWTWGLNERTERQ